MTNTLSAASLHVLRLTLEAQSPISSGGGAATRFDVALVRDANGLPMLSGASLAGVLRRLHADETRPESEQASDVTFDTPTNRLFGWADGDAGAAAQLTFSMGCVHDSRDRAVCVQMDEDDLVRGPIDAASSTDPVLALLASEAPLVRDHVKLDHRHVADGRAKFDRVATPVGVRFSFEVTLWGTLEGAAADRLALLKLAALTQHPLFRVGGAARRGYGQVKLVAGGYACVDAGDRARLRALRRTPPSDISLCDAVLPEIERCWRDSASQTELCQIRLVLQPLGFWRIGNGQAPLRTNAIELSDVNAPEARERGGPDPRARDADVTPMREPKLIWTKTGAGEESAALDVPGPSAITGFVVPGAAIKGALRHRTLYHWRRMAPGAPAAVPAADGGANESVGELDAFFGVAKETSQEGRAARVIVDDAHARPAAVMALDHNSIDRFTGGVRSRALFSQEVAIEGEIETIITLAGPLGEAGRGWSAHLRAAFCAALRDLCEGRLALGAKSMGYCRLANMQWAEGRSSELWRTAWEDAAAEHAARVVSRHLAGSAP